MANDQMFCFDVVKIEVEDAQFVLPKNGLEVSPTFTELMNSVKRDNGAMRLEGVKKADFQLFVGQLFPMFVANAPKMTKAKWITVLTLASEWEFYEVYRRAIIGLVERCKRKPMDVVDKAALASKFGIEEWQSDSYGPLVTRESPLTHEEGEKLGIDFMVKLAKAREEWVKFSRGCVECTCSCHQGKEVDTQKQSRFVEDLLYEHDLRKHCLYSSAQTPADDSDDD